MAFHPAICFRFLSPISRSLPFFQLTATLRCVRPFQPLNFNRTPPSLPGRWSPLWRLFVYMAACSGVFMPFLGSGLILCQIRFWLGTHLPLNMYFGTTRFRLSRVINQPLNMRDWTLASQLSVVHCGCARMHLIYQYILHVVSPGSRQTCILFPWIISCLTYPCVLPLFTLLSLMVSCQSVC